MGQSPQYWFAAKRYGWGWSLPFTWQGWVVCVGWFAALFGGLFALGLRRFPIPHIIFFATMTGLLAAICYWKGEPLRWRWGN